MSGAPNGQSAKIRVLIVDDSAVIRTLLSKILSSDPGIEVVGTATDPYVAREKLVALKPDVMTLDVEMPKMDGVTFLGKVMQHFPTRTIIISTLSTASSEVALRALELGAIDVMAKPTMDVTKSVTEMGQEIIARVKAAAKARLPLRSVVKDDPGATQRAIAAAQAQTGETSARTITGLVRANQPLLVIASSTGGTEALKRVLPKLPPDIPATLIVQHMPPVFTKTYSEHLSKLCAFEVKEAEDGDKVLPGRALLAPGNFHMEMARGGNDPCVRLHQEPLLHGVRPAADYLMKSVAKFAGGPMIGVILTGMGRDGADGLLTMKNAGSFNIGQDEESCVVYGMPKAAADAGAIHKVVTLEKIADEIQGALKMKKAA